MISSFCETMLMGLPCGGDADLEALGCLPALNLTRGMNLHVSSASTFLLNTRSPAGMRCLFSIQTAQSLLFPFVSNLPNMIYLSTPHL